MEIAHREHSSRRQHYQQQLRTQQNNNNESSDIDGTTCRVASVTLESDSLSADQPMSFRSKRRKKIPRKEKQQEMDVDEEHNRQSSQLKQAASKNESEALATNAMGKSIPAYKVQMDWEESDNRPTTSAACKNMTDLGNNQSDVFSDFSDSTSNADADDEQSDWPDLSESNKGNSQTYQQGHFLKPSQSHPVGDAALSAAMVKQVDRFLQDPDQSELLLDQIYRTSAIKQMLRKQSVAVVIVKKGRGTVALKKA